MEERRPVKVDTPAAGRPNQSPQPEEGERLTTADLASANASEPRGERAEPRHAERIAAPETRVEPDQKRAAVAMPPVARPGQVQSGQPTPGQPIAGRPTSSEPAPAATPRASNAAAGRATAQPESKEAPLFAVDESQQLRDRWDEIQAGFVDNPRQAVERADQMVAEVMKRLAEEFAAERDQLERQWSKGGDISTEDLRVTLQRYRSFFGRLLSV